MGSPDRRWPKSVYGVGEDPDPRFSLANERTFLAWIRTSMGMLAAAAVLDALDLPMSPTLKSVLAVAIAAVALLATTQAWIGWAGTERAMRTNQPLPSTRLAMPLVIAIALLAVVVGVLAVIR